MLSCVKRWYLGVTVRSDVPKVVGGVAVGSKRRNWVAVVGSDCRAKDFGMVGLICLTKDRV